MSNLPLRLARARAVLVAGDNAIVAYLLNVPVADIDAIAPSVGGFAPPLRVEDAVARRLVRAARHAPLPSQPTKS